MNLHTCTHKHVFSRNPGGFKKPWTKAVRTIPTRGYQCLLRCIWESTCSQGLGKCEIARLASRFDSRPENVGKKRFLLTGFIHKLLVLGGGNSNIIYFYPYLEKWSNLTNIVQMGWFNHQPVLVYVWVSIWMVCILCVGIQYHVPCCLCMFILFCMIFVLLPSCSM